MYFKLLIKHNGTKLVYPVPVEHIQAPKYRRDIRYCVCELSYNPLLDNPLLEGVEEVSEEYYNQYPNCKLDVDKQSFEADGIEQCTVTVTLPDPEVDTIKLYDGSTLIDYAIVGNGVAIFHITANQPKIFELKAAPMLYGESKEVLVRAV